MILLCGIPSELPLVLVRQKLEELNLPHLVLNQRSFGDVELEFEITPDKVAGGLWLTDKYLPLESFTGIYARLTDCEPMLHFHAPEPDALKVRCVHDAVLRWLEVSPCRVVNRPSAMGSNFSKPYQLQLIQSQGFSVPETLVTNDPDLVREFSREHEQVVYKSISSVRSIVRMMCEQDYKRLDRILACPTQFQEFVDGINVRVHVVDQTVYASAIATDAIDYRYAYREGRPVEIYGIQLPEGLCERCVGLAEMLQLPFAGIDLKITAQNEVYCFEVNPSPAYSYYEEQTGQSISRSLAMYLAGVGVAS